ncbi:hypothetical protein [Flavobacterium sp. 7A]|uniref:hypothetical protein n=1 Tax=Flavobacterium sp. 7A TaxID=2940571 RepID=UPI0022270493|nr:hypothetical protein [Flavobacterium sp. 7A]MCW2118757.1 hypothetical protein [Flavobacterium sp. 7A]
MEVDNEVRLLLRFHKNVPQKTSVLLSKFIAFSKTKQEHYYAKISGNHIWLHIIGPEKKYFSPHLHLELETPSENETHIRGLFGPDQTLWTFFMFLHFIIAGIFLVFCGILYSNYVLKNALTLDFTLLGLMVIAWFSLYFIARQIRHSGNDQMNALEKVFLEILES